MRPGPDRLPPQNLEAEMSVLGCALFDNAAIDDMARLVRPGDMYRRAHEVAWREIVAMNDQGDPVDSLTLLERLRASGKLDAIGGPEAISEWMEATPGAANAEYYASIVRQKSLSRQLIEMANRMLRDGYSDQHDADELIRLADADLAQISDTGRRKELVTLGDAARDSLRRYDLRVAGQHAGTRTGFTGLDELIGGFRPAQLIVLGARPGMGKTALAMNFLESAAMLATGSALFVSLEMGVGELGDRAICSATGYDSTAYRRDRGYGIDRDLLSRKVAEMDGLPILIEETPGLSPSQIAAVARKARRRGPLSLVIVDYLQIIGSDDRRASEYDRVGAASLALKNLSKQVACPVIALSQLNRQVEEREDKRPRLFDLRASGTIEQDADVVMFLYREGYYDKSKDQRPAELIVEKNREGATGLVPLHWDGPLTRFNNPEADIDFGPDGGGAF